MTNYSRWVNWFACALSRVLCSRWQCGAPSLQSAGTGAEPAVPRSGGRTGEAGPHLGPNICVGHVFGYDGETLSSHQYNVMLDLETWGS